MISSNYVITGCKSLCNYSGKLLVLSLTTLTAHQQNIHVLAAVSASSRLLKLSYVNDLKTKTSIYIYMTRKESQVSRQQLKIVQQKPMYIFKIYEMPKHMPFFWAVPYIWLQICL